MVRFTSELIDPARVYKMLENEAAGSVLFHFAVAKAIRNASGLTRHITYEPNGNVEQELWIIETEMKENWELTDVLLLRRQGTVAVGEIISLVAVSSPGSKAAFAACRFGLERLKTMSTIIKTEVPG